MPKTAYSHLTFSYEESTAQLLMLGWPISILWMAQEQCQNQWLKKSPGLVRMIFSPKVLRNDLQL